MMTTMITTWQWHQKLLLPSGLIAHNSFFSGVSSYPDTDFSCWSNQENIVSCVVTLTGKFTESPICCVRDVTFWRYLSKVLIS